MREKSDINHIEVYEMRYMAAELLRDIFGLLMGWADQFSCVRLRIIMWTFVDLLLRVSLEFSIKKVHKIR